MASLCYSPLPSSRLPVSPCLYQSLQVDVQKFSLQKDGLQREKEEAQRELEQLEKDVGAIDEHL